MPHVRRLGLDAEDQAAEFLAGQGYTLLTRRFKAGGGEIDLVALEGSTLVFVEVKQRRGDDALIGVDLAKQSRILAASQVYLARYDGPPCEVRFDVITIERSEMRLIKDAFRPR